jgi:hypothetical protein
MKKKHASAGAVRGETRRRPSPKEETAMSIGVPRLLSPSVIIMAPREGLTLKKIIAAG